MENDGKTDNRQVTELRFELAWRWFALHSSQRASMLQYFLLSAGVLANAYVWLIIYELDLPAAILAFVSAAISAAFVLLDKRNHQLVKIGEDLIVHLEATELKTRELGPASGDMTHSRGVLLRELVEGQPGFYLKHWFLVGSVEMLASGLFLAGGVFALAR